MSFMPQPILRFGLIVICLYRCLRRVLFHRLRRLLRRRCYRRSKCTLYQIHRLRYRLIDPFRCQLPLHSTPTLLRYTATLILLPRSTWTRIVTPHLIFHIFLTLKLLYIFNTLPLKINNFKRLYKLLTFNLSINHLLFLIKF